MDDAVASSSGRLHSEDLPNSVAAVVEEGHIDMKCRLNGVLDKLKDCSGEIERIMTDTRHDGSSEEWSDLLSTVWEMLGALETGLKRVPEKQRSEEESLRSDPGICTHTCVHHPDTMNPELWSKLTEDMVALVFARLPIPQIVQLRKSLAGWAALSNSASFKDTFAEVNPKLFGLVGWRGNLALCTSILDAEYKEWHELELNFPEVDPWYACDGGLVCFVPQWAPNRSDCIVVCNPLTDTWRKLPNLWEDFGFPDPVIMQAVQLVTNELSYRVILVYSEKVVGEDPQTFGAIVYNSETTSWSGLSSGLVYGTRDSFSPLVFDCTTKRLVHLNRCAAIRNLYPVQQSLVLKDRLFVLQHVRYSPDDDTNRYVISEFTWESSRSDMNKLNDYEFAMRDVEDTDNVTMFVSTGLILTAWNIQSRNEYVRFLLLKLYDISAGQWRDLPPLVRVPGIQNEDLDDFFMWELRWDANP